MLQMKKTEHETKLFNMDRFIALWSVDKEQAREYQRECEAYWNEYCKANNPELKAEVENVSTESKKEQTVDKVDDTKPVIEQKTEEQLKLDMVKILKDSGMKLASTKWSLATLTKKVAELKK